MTLWQRARKRSKASLRLKSFKELPMLVFGSGSISIIVTEANTANKVPTASQMNEEITISCYQGT